MAREGEAIGKDQIDELVAREATSGEDAGTFALSLGLERIGLASLKAPLLMLLVMLALAVGAWLGISRIKVDDSLTELFRTNSAEFRQYEELSNRFPSSEFDVLVVAESDKLLERDKVAALRELVTELQLVDSMTGLVSLFSAREAPTAGGLPPPLFPDALPEGAAYDALIERVKANEIIKGKLISQDGTLALIVLALDRKIVESRGLREAVGEIQATVDEKLAGTGIRAQLSGAPVMQLEIRNSVERDQFLYNGLGFLLGVLIALAFFRRISLMLMTAMPPVIAIVWSLGTLGWLDFRLNLFLNVMTPLIMVMAFSDSMQITCAVRDRLIAGDSKTAALRWAILTIGPACVLTDATAGLSFVTLLFSDSALIRAFGMAGAISTLISFIAVIMVIPLLGMLLIRDDGSLKGATGGEDWAMDGVKRGVGALTASVVARPAMFSLLGLLLVAGFGWLHLSLEPRYRLADQVPDREQAVAAGERLDAKLTGANPIHVLIELPAGRDLYDPRTLDSIAAVHAILEKQSGVGNVWSLETLRRWIEEKVGSKDTAVLRRYVDILPAHLTQRFIAVDKTAVVVTGRIPDEDSSRILPIIKALDASMDRVRKADAEIEISVTGLSAIAARNSAEMIGQLNHSLTVEMVFVAALIGLAFRSVVIALVSTLPGLFPIVASGALLFALGEGLQFASIIALTVAFGLGLDATIHYLNRLRLEDRPGEDPALGVTRAAILMGPALVLTTVVLACGLAVTVFSDLPSLRLFGALCAVTLMAALVGDLVILPATLLLVRRWTRRWSIRGPGS